MKSKFILMAILIFIALVVGAILLSGKGNNPDNPLPIENVAIKDGKQVIGIEAKGGYSPQLTMAKADVPTVLRINTQGTFDCSSSLVIPSLKYRSFLPPSGETLIEIPPQRAGTTLEGLCSMGMYSFAINFN